MKYTLSLVFVFILSSAHAQVKDISFTLSPVVEHVWWDSQAGLGDDFLFGGKVGFGFGEFLEINGVFMTSSGLATDFSSFGLTNFEAADLTAQNVRLTRWGGEAKINFSSSSISPYATLGTGIQKIGLTDASNDTEQIYASLGLGLRFALSKRINFLLEARATGFQYNAGSNLLTAEQMNDLGMLSNDFERENLLNFGALAAIQIYLGGRKPGELSEFDRAYLKKIKGGFKGWSWAFEPSIGYASFDNNSLFRNTWMAGGYFGMDFNEYVGVRAFFYQALEDGKLGFSTDPLNMYGLELRAKLNDGNGVNPYLILGGGRLNANSNYEGAIPGLSAQTTNFANAGLGLDIPLGRNFLITGAIRAMAASGVDATDLLGPEDLQTHVLYNFGVKLQLGKKIETALTYESEAEDQLRNLEKSLNVNDEEYVRLKKLIDAYEEELKQLDLDLENATKNNYTSKAVDILEEKKSVNQALSEVKKIQRKLQTPETEKGEYYKMTPDEFEHLIDRILQGIDEKYAPKQAPKQATVIPKDLNDQLMSQLIYYTYKDYINESRINKNEIFETTPLQQKSNSEKDRALDEMLLILKKNNEEEGKRKIEVDTRLESIQNQLKLYEKRLEDETSKIESKVEEAKSSQKSNEEKQYEIDQRINSIQKKLEDFNKRLETKELKTTETEND